MFHFNKLYSLKVNSWIISSTASQLFTLYGEHTLCSQHAPLPIYTINTQSVVPHEFINELCHSVRVQQRRESGVNYLLKAVWVQLRLVYYLNCHLWREREREKMHRNRVKWNIMAEKCEKEEVEIKKAQRHKHRKENSIDFMFLKREKRLFKRRRESFNFLIKKIWQLPNN